MTTPDALTLREQLMSRPFRRADLPADPLAQFAAWFAEAQAADLPTPHAMSLATADAAGRVSSRLVLLRLFDADGLVFFTGLETQKTRAIAQNPQVALLFPWLLLNRQVRVEGTAVALSKAAALRYFLSRPRGSQLGAWASDQSRVIADRAALEARLRAVEAEYADRAHIERPPHWGGFRLEPEVFEFWQGRPSRLHDRHRFRRVNGGWIRERLSP